MNPTGRIKSSSVKCLIARSASIVLPRLDLQYAAVSVQQKGARGVPNGVPSEKIALGRPKI